MKTYKAFLFPVILLSLLAPAAGCRNPLATPKEKDVSEAVERQRERELERVKFNAFIRNLFRNTGKGLRDNRETVKTVFTLAVILIAVLVATLAVFLVLRFRSTRQYGEALKSEAEAAHREISFRQEELDSFLSASDFSGAIVYLHRCTIFELILRGITYNRNMTNLTLYRRVQDPALASSFRSIYTAAERVLFDGYRATEEDFRKCDADFGAFRGEP